MKIYLNILSSLCLLFGAGCATTPPLSAETSVPVTYVPAEPGPMDQLLAPISLYPDALVAIILPAATASSDVVLAARFLGSGNNRDQIDAQPWDDSVKALAHYPDVVAWMDENLAWTQQLGAAYLDQPEEVMAAVQRNRLRARANGVLVDTPEQQVVVEDGYVRIIPAQADVIYVPRYDPEIIYVERPVYYASDPWLTFGIGFGVGSWLSYDCDWRSRVIWVDRNHDRWRNHRDWRSPDYSHRPGYASNPSGWQRWQPTPGRPRPYPRHYDQTRWKNEPRPTPIAGAPIHNQFRSRDQSRPERPANVSQDRAEQYRQRREAVAAPSGPMRVAQPGVSENQVQNGPRRTDPNSRTNDNRPRRLSNETPWTSRAVQPSAPVAQSAPSAPVVAAPTPSRTVPNVNNAPSRRYNNQGTPGRRAEPRQAAPTPVISGTPSPSVQPVQSMANRVAQHVSMPPPAARVAPTRQPEMHNRLPSVPQAVRSAPPVPQAVRSAPAPQAASPQRGQGSSQRNERSDRSDKD